MQFSEVSEELEFVRYDKEKRANVYIIDGKEITLLISTSPQRMEYIKNGIKEDMNKIESTGFLNTKDQWETLQEIESNFPMRHANLLGEMQRACDRRDELEIQKSQLKFYLKDYFKQKRMITLNNKDEIESALLHYNRLYALAATNLNIEKNWVDYLDSITDMYKYVDTRMKTKSQARKDQREVLYD